MVGALVCAISVRHCALNLGLHQPSAGAACLQQSPLLDLTQGCLALVVGQLGAEGKLFHGLTCHPPGGTQPCNQDEGGIASSAHPQPYAEPVPWQACSSWL